jgi:hypothetical protein
VNQIWKTVVAMAPDSTNSPARNPCRICREIGILLPNNQRQHSTLRIQEDLLPYAFVQKADASVVVILV